MLITSNGIRIVMQAIYLLSHSRIYNYCFTFSLFCWDNKNQVFNLFLVRCIQICLIKDWNQLSLEWHSLIRFKTYCELSNNLDNMADSTGRSAITAVVITALLPSVVFWLAFSVPPDDGFKPSIHTKCFKLRWT